MFSKLMWVNVDNRGKCISGERLKFRLLPNLTITEKCVHAYDGKDKRNGLA